jgi:hypothetical protein
VLAGSSALKRRTRVDVDSAHATLLRRVGAHAGLREVLGSPIVGARGNARVALVTGGEWRRDDEGTTIQTNDSKPLYKNADRSGGSAKPTRSRSSRSFSRFLSPRPETSHDERNGVGGTSARTSRFPSPARARAGWWRRRS